MCRNAAGTAVVDHQYDRSNATCRNTDVCNATNARDPCGMSWYRDKCPGCGPISVKGSVGTSITSAQKHARPVLNHGAQKNAKFCGNFRGDFRQDRSPPWIRNILEKMKMTKDSCDTSFMREQSAVVQTQVGTPFSYQDCHMLPVHRGETGPHFAPGLQGAVAHARRWARRTGQRPRSSRTSPTTPRWTCTRTP